MKKTNKTYFIDILISVVLAVVGYLLYTNLEPGVKTTSYIISGVMLAIAALSFYRLFKNNEEKKLFNMNLIYAIVSLLSGIFLIITPSALTTVIRIILALWIIINSSAKLNEPFKLKEHKLWYITLIIPIINIIGGLLIFFNPFKNYEILKTIGIITIIYGIINITNIIIITVLKKRTEARSAE